MQFQTGWRTYTCAAIAAAIGVDQGLIAAGVHGVPAVPGFVIFLLTAAGLYSARAATTNDVSKATQDILAQVTVPVPAPVTVNVTNQTPQQNSTITSAAPLPQMPAQNSPPDIDNLTFNRTLR